MKIFPELSKNQVHSEISRWVAQTWGAETLNNLTGKVAASIESGAVFAGVSWAPLGDRISPDDLLTIRQDLVQKVDAFAVKEQKALLPRMSGVTDCDFSAAEVLWQHFSEIGGGMASCADCWGWLAVRVIPDFIVQRWSKGDGSLSAERFTNTTKVRCWPQHLWWYAWSCSSDSRELNPDLMNFMKSADARAAMLERTGRGYDRSMLQAIMRHLIKVEAEGSGDQSVEFLLRGMMVRLSWLSGVRNIDALNGEEKRELAATLCDWAREHYTGKR